MKNYIFYFTGTGNSLYVAKKIAEEIENTELISIANNIDKGYEIEKADRVGFVIPVYAFREPLIVEEFLKKLNICEYNYLYTFLVHGGSPLAATDGLAKKLTEKDFNVTASYDLKTPSNYITGGNLPNETDANKILENQSSKLEQIIDSIKSRNRNTQKIIFWKRWLGALIRPLLKSAASKTAKNFYTTDKCNGCGICSKLCPGKIISLNKEKKPVWSGDNCEMCYACINLCPQKAIENGKNTKDRNRYKNPKISLNELIN